MIEILDNRVLINNNKNIRIIDYVGGAFTKCKCGREATFTVIIDDTAKHLCEKCMGDLGKLIIDALI